MYHSTLNGAIEKLRLTKIEMAKKIVDTTLILVVVLDKVKFIPIVKSSVTTKSIKFPIVRSILFSPIIKRLKP